MTRVRQHSRRGSAVLEASLVFFPLLILTFGCVEYGYFFYVKHTLQGAAREGARAAATGTAMVDVTNAVQGSMNAAGFAPAKYSIEVATLSGSDPNNPTVTPITTISATTPTAGTSIRVRVYGTWNNLGVKVMSLIDIDPAKVVVGATTMRREG